MLRDPEGVLLWPDIALNAAFRCLVWALSAPWPAPAGAAFALDPPAFFNEIAAHKGPDETMSDTNATAPRSIYWPSVITVVSAAILIGAEVFGAAFAGGWALGILMGLDETFTMVLQGLLFVIGVAIMVTFVRGAQRIEPFTRRS
jgi:hypothetical protein